MASHPAPPPSALAQRTNTELNLSVLKRYIPSIAQILSIAANAVVYTFDYDTQAWDKAGVEGTMFICTQNDAPASVHGGEAAWEGEKGCLFVLNRRGLDNMVLDLSEVSKIEVGSMGEIEMLILVLNADATRAQAQSSNGNEDTGLPKVLGIWIHADTNETRTMNHALVQEMWNQVQVAASRRQSSAGSEDSEGASLAVEEKETDVGPAMQAIGRRIDIGDLFGKGT